MEISLKVTNLSLSNLCDFSLYMKFSVVNGKHQGEVIDHSGCHDNISCNCYSYSVPLTVCVVSSRMANNW